MKKAQSGFRHRECENVRSVPGHSDGECDHPDVELKVVGESVRP